MIAVSHSLIADNIQLECLQIQMRNVVFTNCVLLGFSVDTHIYPPLLPPSNTGQLKVFTELWPLFREGLSALSKQACRLLPLTICSVFERE